MRQVQVNKALTISIDASEQVFFEPHGVEGWQHLHVIGHGYVHVFTAIEICAVMVARHSCVCLLIQDVVY
jgi:hypothetical protein